MPKNLDLEKLVSGYDSQMKMWEEERDHAAANGWFDKAAKYDVLIEGMRKARFMASSGDYHAK